MANREIEYLHNRINLLERKERITNNAVVRIASHHKDCEFYRDVMIEYGTLMANLTVDVENVNEDFSDIIKKREG